MIMQVPVLNDQLKLIPSREVSWSWWQEVGS